MSNRVSIGLMVAAMSIGIAPMADAGHCCHVRHHHHGCGCAVAPTCGCAAAPSCGCTSAPSCGAPGATPMMAPRPATPPAPMPPAPGKAAEYSPNGPTPAWRIGETPRPENQTYQNYSAEPKTGNVSGDSNDRNGQSDPAERSLTIPKRSNDNSTETSKTTNEENNSNGTTSKDSNGNNAP